MRTKAPAEVKIFFDQMILGAGRFSHYNDLSIFKGSDELQLTCMVATITHWRKLYNENFAAVHDATANFLRRRETWERMTNETVPQQMISLGDGTTVEFPLRVTSTTAVDSKKNYSVQFCDVLAGLSARVFDARIKGTDREMLNDVLLAGMGKLRWNGVRPDTIFPDKIPPRRLTGSGFCGPDDRCHLRPPQSCRSRRHRLSFFK